MYRRPLADVQKAFSRLFQQNVHRYTHGLSELSGRCTDTTMWMSLLQPARRTESPCCLCPVSGHALRAVQPASESACSFLFLQPSVHSFCTPSVHLLYTFCTPSVHLLHILYISGRSTNPIYWCGSVSSLGGGLEAKNILFFHTTLVWRSESSLHTMGPPVLLNSIIGTPGGRYMRLVTPLRAPFAAPIAPSHRGGLVHKPPP